jgi:hypothetical protein
MTTLKSLVIVGALLVGRSTLAGEKVSAKVGTVKDPARNLRDSSQSVFEVDADEV